jgi:hypothetical protein
MGCLQKQRFSCTHSFTIALPQLLTIANLLADHCFCKISTQSILYNCVARFLFFVYGLRSGFLLSFLVGNLHLHTYGHAAIIMMDPCLYCLIRLTWRSTCNCNCNCGFTLVTAVAVLYMFAMTICPRGISNKSVCKTAACVCCNVVS